MSDSTDAYGDGTGTVGLADEVQPTSGVARDAAWSLVARIVAMVCSSATALIVANALTASEYGGYAVVVGINVVLVMSLDLGLTSALARYVAQARASTQLVVQVALVRIALVGVASLVVLGAMQVPSIERSAIAALLPALALLLLAQSAIAFHFGSLPSLRRIRLLLALTVLQPIVELALVLVVRARDASAEGMLLATVCSAGAVAILGWVVLLAPGRAAAASIPTPSATQLATLRMVAHYGRRIFLVSLLIAVFGQIDQFVIGLFHPLAAVAPYALVIKLQALIAAPAITVAGIVAPRIAGAGTRALALYRQWLTFLIVLDLGAVLVVAALAPQVFDAIGGQYRDDWPLLVGMSPFLLLAAVAPLPSITLNQTGHAGSRLRIAAITVTINVVLDLALVPSFAATGAAIGTTAAFAYYLVQHHRIVERALADQTAGPVTTINAALLAGSLVAVLVASGAWLLRLVLEGSLDVASPVALAVVPALVAALVHGAWSARIVRRPLDV